jgi:serine/threonine protein kinase
MRQHCKTVHEKVRAPPMSSSAPNPPTIEELRCAQLCEAVNEADRRAAVAKAEADDAAAAAAAAAAEAAAFTTTGSAPSNPALPVLAVPSNPAVSLLAVGQRLCYKTFENMSVDVLALLQRGGFGEVAKVRWGLDGTICAAKVARADKRAAGLEDIQLREAQTLARLPAHANIVRYIDAFTERRSLALVIVMEFAECGSARDAAAAQHARGEAAYKRWALDIGIQLARGLAHLHAHGIVHQDVSPANTLLFADARGLNIAKLTDFGLAGDTFSSRPSPGMPAVGNPSELKVFADFGEATSRGERVMTAEAPVPSARANHSTFPLCLPLLYNRATMAIGYVLAIVLVPTVCIANAIFDVVSACWGCTRECCGGAGRPTAHEGPLLSLCLNLCCGVPTMALMAIRAQWEGILKAVFCTYLPFSTYFPWLGPLVLSLPLWRSPAARQDASNKLLGNLRLQSDTRWLLAHPSFSRCETGLWVHEGVSNFTPYMRDLSRFSSTEHKASIHSEATAAHAVQLALPLSGAAAGSDLLAQEARYAGYLTSPGVLVPGVTLLRATSDYGAVRCGAVGVFQQYVHGGLPPCQIRWVWESEQTDGGGDVLSCYWLNWRDIELVEEPIPSTLTRRRGRHKWYCSAEQAAGLALSTASDVWSWAATLRHLLTGHVLTAPAHGVGEQAAVGLGKSAGDVFFLRCFSPTPAKRPSPADCVIEAGSLFEGLCAHSYPRVPAPPVFARGGARQLQAEARLLSKTPAGSTDAEALLRRALELDPCDVNALMELAVFLVHQPPRFPLWTGPKRDNRKMLLGRAEAHALVCRALESEPDRADVRQFYQDQWPEIATQHASHTSHIQHTHKTLLY